MKLTIACCQVPVTEDLEQNLATAERYITNAAHRGAQIVLLPEMFCCPYDNSCFPSYAQPVDGEIAIRLANAAKKHGIYLFAGSFPEREGENIYNTCLIFDRTGTLIGRHRKAHLFDINVEGGVAFQESAILTAGNAITTVLTEYGPIGVAICFDMRFVEPFRIMALRGAKLIVLPSAFNMTTGPAHWELTLRARALDNQVFIAACAPAQNPDASYLSYGHSMVTSPWGDVLGQLGFEEGILLSEIDLDKVDAVRKQLPIVSARRTDLYELKEL